MKNTMGIKNTCLIFNMKDFKIESKKIMNEFNDIFIYLLSFTKNC